MAMASLGILPSLLSSSVSTSRSDCSVCETKGMRSLGGTNRRLAGWTRSITRGVDAITRVSRNALRRPGGIRATSEQLAARESVDNAAERERLKKQLKEQIVAASGNLTEECLATIAELEKVNPNLEALKHPELYAGYWERVKAAHVGTGRKGESKVEVGYEGARATLGRATFQTFKPEDLEIVMGEVYNYVPVVGVEEKKYVIMIHFTTENPKGDGFPPIEGLILNGATPSIENPLKMVVAFDETKLRPCYPERDLAAWKEIFEEASGGTMNEIGEITVINEKPPLGYLQVLYIDDEIRITRGNLGSCVVVRRMDQPPRFVR